MPVAKRSFQERRKETNARYYQNKKTAQQTQGQKEETNFYDRKELF